LQCAYVHFRLTRLIGDEKEASSHLPLLGWRILGSHAIPHIAYDASRIFTIIIRLPDIGRPFIFSIYLFSYGVDDMRVGDSIFTKEGFMRPYVNDAFL
jgi:hypothetical protein